MSTEDQSAKVVSATGGVTLPPDMASAPTLPADAYPSDEAAGSLPVSAVVAEGFDGAALLPRGTLVGRYQVLEPLAAGGLGVVYRAHDPQLDRKVALKLVRAQRQRSEPERDARTRLLREAQALAKLDHPNVIPVFDAGTHGNEVFLAMGLVEGRTLAEWLREAPRSISEILAAYVAAGRGLVAAHEAGIVHRDFKPENVIVGRDGSVRVLDFGLARSASDPREQTAVSALAETDVRSDAVLRLTRTGARLGTPRYMAPEQHLGLDVDARTDQFSFAVALYEALYREPPFPGETLKDLAMAVTLGHLRPAPRGTAVPTWLRRVVLRALSLDPKERYPSMAQLLAELDPARTERRGRVRAAVALACAAVVTLGAVVGLRAKDARIELCQRESQAITDAWGPEARRAVRAAFAESGVPAWEVLWQATTNAMDAYARRWSEAAEETCAATVVRGTQTEAMRSLRRTCLDHRRAEVKQLAGLLGAADRALVQKGLDAVGGLSPLEPCSDEASLFSLVAPPKDAATARRAEELRQTLGEVRVLAAASRFDEALERASAAVEGATVLGYAPVLAEATVLRGLVYAQTGREPARAASELSSGFRSALAAREFVTAGAAAARLTLIVGHVLSRRAEGHDWARLADAVLGDERSAEADDVRIDLYRFDAFVFDDEEAATEALAAARRAFDIAQRRRNADDRFLARMHTALGVANSTAGALEEARGHFRKAVELAERSAGPEHPIVATYLSNLAVLETRDGHYELAEALARRALAIHEKVFGPEHVQFALTLVSVGEAQADRGACAEAMGYLRRARPILLAQLGEDAEDVVGVNASLAMCELEAGNVREADKLADEAARGGTTMDLPAMSRAFLDYVVGSAAWAAGKDREASRARVEGARKILAPMRLQADGRRLLGKIDGWLETHPSSPLPPRPVPHAETR